MPKRKDKSPRKKITVCVDGSAVPQNPSRPLGVAWIVATRKDVPKKIVCGAIKNSWNADKVCWATVAEIMAATKFFELTKPGPKIHFYSDHLLVVNALTNTGGVGERQGKEILEDLVDKMKRAASRHKITLIGKSREGGMKSPLLELAHHYAHTASTGKPNKAVGRAASVKSITYKYEM